MMKTYRLLHNLDFDVTRPVSDMAALFAYTPAVKEAAADLILRVEVSGSLCRALIEWGGRLYVSEPVKLGSSVSGEITRCVKLAVLDALARFTGQRPDLPWGILTGVRPGKLAHKLVDGGVAFGDLPRVLNERYLLPIEQGMLLSEICRRQKAVVPDKNKEAGIYIGIPFCPSKCSYCSFPSGIIPKDEESQQNFLKFIEQDVENVVKLLSMHSLNITSVYIGGGTPTSFSESAFARLLQSAGKLLVPTVREFTVEAGRPDCFTKGKLSAMVCAGVNRISVNPQTFHDKTLRIIGRSHTVADFYRAYEMAANSGIPVINMDFIIGLPGETIDDIAYSLQAAAALKPQNLTIHTLTQKKGAELFGTSMNLSASDAAQMVESGRQAAREMGMEPYYLYRQHYMLGHLANIGYALPGTECIYNIQMMEERHTVIGIGPSAATKVPQPDGHSLKKLNMPKNIFTYTGNLQQLAEKRAGLL